MEVGKKVIEKKTRMDLDATLKLGSKLINCESNTCLDQTMRNVSRQMY